MNYIKINSYGLILGGGASNIDDVPALPGETIIKDVTAPVGLSTVHRYVDGEVVDTGQPITPPGVGWTWNDELFRWVDSRGLQQVKDEKWEEIKSARSFAEYGGFVWDGSTFDSDSLSQQKIIGASQMATLTPGFTIDWTLADNTVRTLSATDMNAVGIALGQHVNTQYVHARVLRQQIETATTKEEVAAITW